MKKFKFRLQQVLNFRMTLKDERKRELLTANQRVREAEEEISRLEKELVRFEIADGAVLRIEELTQQATYRERIKAALVNCHESLALRRHEAQEALDRYIEAAKEANALDTLKNRRYQEYMERIQKVEESILDEGAVQRAGRRQLKLAEARRQSSRESGTELDKNI